MIKAKLFAYKYNIKGVALNDGPYKHYQRWLRYNEFDEILFVNYSDDKILVTYREEKDK